MEEETVETVEMIRASDKLINHVLPENVQDYLDSGLWAIVNKL